MVNKVVVITGGTDGMGYEIVQQMAMRGAKVIIASRDEQRGEQIAAEAKKLTGNNSIISRKCDLSSIASVRQFAEHIKTSETQIDVLILNAGIIASNGKNLNEDGHELQFAVNHLGHFLLTQLLLDMIRSSKARVVIVSSIMHWIGNIDFDNLSFEKYVPGLLSSHANTKLANMLFMMELARRLEGTGATANACHPGIVKTQIRRNCSFWVRHFLEPIEYFIAGKSPLAGAQTTIHLAICDHMDGVNGKYFSDCHPVCMSSRCTDPDLAKKFWDVSEVMSGLKRYQYC